MGIVIPELGHLAMILAFCLALVQALIPLLGAWRSDWLWINVAQSAAWGQFVFLLFAFSCLVYAFVTDDFSVAYVASNSNSALPWYYKFSATWGAHEGSLLFSNVRRKLPQLVPSPYGTSSWLAMFLMPSRKSGRRLPK